MGAWAWNLNMRPVIIKKIKNVVFGQLDKNLKSDAVFAQRKQKKQTNSEMMTGNIWNVMLYAGFLPVKWARLLNNKMMPLLRASFWPAHSSGHTYSGNSPQFLVLNVTILCDVSMFEATPNANSSPVSLQISELSRDNTVRTQGASDLADLSIFGPFQWEALCK